MSLPESPVRCWLLTIPHTYTIFTFVIISPRTSSQDMLSLEQPQESWWFSNESFSRHTVTTSGILHEPSGTKKLMEPLEDNPNPNPNPIRLASSDSMPLISSTLKSSLRMDMVLVSKIPLIIHWPHMTPARIRTISQSETRIWDPFGIRFISPMQPRDCRNTSLVSISPLSWCMVCKDCALTKQWWVLVEGRFERSHYLSCHLWDFPRRLLGIQISATCSQRKNGKATSTI